MKKKYLVMAILIIAGTALVSLAWSWYLDYKEADKSLYNIEKKEVLVVGSNMPYGVMEFFDENNQPAGVDVDIAKALAARLGVDLRFENYNWDELFAKVKNGGIDLAMSSISITEKRQREMLFSDPYFNAGQVVIVNSENNNLEGINSLVGKKIAVFGNSTGYDEALKYTSEDLISVYVDFDSETAGRNMIADLKSEKIDAAIIDYVLALSLIKADSEIKIVGVPFTKENYGIATRIDNVLLIKKINSILFDMEKKGELQAIKIKWAKY